MSSQSNQKEQAKKLLRAITDIDDRFLMEAMKEDERLEAAGVGTDKAAEESGRGAVSSTPGAAGFDKDGVTGTSGSDKDGASGTTSLDKDGATGAADFGKGGATGAADFGKEGATGLDKDGASRAAGFDKDGVTGAADSARDEISSDGNKRSRRKLRRYSAWALTAAACLVVVVIGRYVSVNTVKDASVRPAAVSEERKQTGSEQGNQNSGQQDQSPEQQDQDTGKHNQGVEQQDQGAEQKDQDAVQQDQSVEQRDQDAVQQDQIPERKDQNAGLGKKSEDNKMKDSADEAEKMPAEDTAMEAGPGMAEEAAGPGMAEEAAEPDMAAENSVQSAGEITMNSAAEAITAEDSGMAAGQDIQADGEEQMDFAAEASAAADSDAASAFAAPGAGAGAMLAIPNPFIDADTLEEAEEAAGFSITLPTLDTADCTIVYRAMKGEMIEVIYLDEYNREKYRIRKGLNMEDDISGVDYEYAETRALETENGIEVTVWGEDAKGDQWGTAVWTQEAGTDTRYSYSINNGRGTFTTKEVLEIVEEMTTEAENTTE